MKWLKSYPRLVGAFLAVAVLASLVTFVHRVVLAGPSDVFSLNEGGTDIFRVKTGGDVVSGTIDSTGRIGTLALAVTGQFSVGYTSASSVSFLMFVDTSNGNIYRTVRNEAGKTLNVGSVVVWATTSTATGGAANTIYGVSITTASTRNQAGIAGVLAENISAGSRGKMVIWGATTVLSAGTDETQGAVEGSDIITSTRPAFGDTITSTTSHTNAIGVWLQTSTSTTAGSRLGLIGSRSR